MTKAAAKTAVGPMMLVAAEQFFGQQERIVEDNWAYRLLPWGMKALVWLTRPKAVRDWVIRVTEKDAPGLWAGMMCRKRYIAEKLTDSTTQVDAVVNLGAGFDTLAYRLPVLSATPVWEVDDPEVIEAKRACIQKVLGEIPSNVDLAATDFDCESLSSVLESHGYSTERRTFFVWEAVTQYLTEEGIRNTLDFLARAAPGSRLALTYVRKDFLEGQALYDWEKGYREYVETKLWIFGMEPGAWPEFLGEYGWQVVEDVGYDELANEYVQPTGRELASTSIERMVYAEKL